MSYDSVSCIQDYELKKGVLVVVSIIFIVFFIAEQLFMATYIVYCAFESTLVSFMRSIVSFEKEKSEVQLEFLVIK